MNQNNVELNQKTISRAFYEVMADLATSEDDPVLLGWRDRESQTIRFDVFKEKCVKSGDSVLDFGCGTCDLYSYLKEDGITVNYTGIDIMQSFVDKAKTIYGDEIRVINTNILIYMEKFDWVFGSGVFSVGFDMDSLTEYVRHLVSISNKGVCFNLLNSETFKGDVQSSFSIKEVKETLTSMFSDYTVSFETNYADEDFSVIISQ
jgi:SAM-dependent methyltransferase